MREAVHQRDCRVERGDRIGSYGVIGLPESILRDASTLAVDEKSTPFAAQSELVTVELSITDSERQWLVHLLNSASEYLHLSYPGRPLGRGCFCELAASHWQCCIHLQATLGSPQRR
jgi:hypothetical protein